MGSPPEQSPQLNLEEKPPKMLQRFSYVIRSSISSSALHQTPRKLPIFGLIFDLDGTLTLPVLDFKVLRKRIACPPPRDILEFIRSKPEEEKTKLLKIVEDFENEGNENMKLQPGLHSMLKFISENGLQKAIVTRNAKPCVDIFLKKLGDPSSYGGPFSHLLTRDFIPSKPDPAPIRHICKEWNLDPRNVIMVGDHFHDITCGLDAGSVTVLVNNTKNSAYKEISDFNVDSLEELVTLLQSDSMVVTRTEVQGK